MIKLKKEKENLICLKSGGIHKLNLKKGDERMNPRKRNNI